MRLGQAERAQHFATRQGREPVALLLRVAVAHEDGVDRAVGHADGGAGAAVARSDFLQHQRQRHVIQPGATVLLGHANAVSPQLRQPLVHVAREMVLLVPAGRMGGDLFAHEVTHGVAHHGLVLRQQHRGLLGFF